MNGEVLAALLLIAMVLVPIALALWAATVFLDPKE
jgi:hypothetical protein